MGELMMRKVIVFIFFDLYKNGKGKNEKICKEEKKGYLRVSVD